MIESLHILSTWYLKYSNSNGNGNSYQIIKTHCVPDTVLRSVHNYLISSSQHSKSYLTSIISVIYIWKELEYGKVNNHTEIKFKS